MELIQQIANFLLSAAQLCVSLVGACVWPVLFLAVIVLFGSDLRTALRRGGVKVSIPGVGEIVIPQGKTEAEEPEVYMRRVSQQRAVVAGPEYVRYRAITFLHDRISFMSERPGIGPAEEMRGIDRTVFEHLFAWVLSGESSSYENAR